MGVNKTQHRALDKVAMDHRVDEIWDEGSDGIWISLKPGFNWEGCICVHEWTVPDLIESLENVVVGNPY